MRAGCHLCLCDAKHLLKKTIQSSILQKYNTLYKDTQIGQTEHALLVVTPRVCAHVARLDLL